MHLNNLGLNKSRQIPRATNGKTAIRPQTNGRKDSKGTDRSPVAIIIGMGAIYKWEMQDIYRLCEQKEIK